MKAREDYNTLLNSGMFWEFHPELTGNWKEDRLKWFEIQGLLTESSSMIDKLKLIFDNETQEETLESWEMSCYGCRKAIKDAQYTRILNYIVNLSPELVNSEFERLLKWEDKYEEFQYTHRYKQTESKLFHTVIKIIKDEFSDELPITKDDDFVADKFEWNSYRFTLFCGQGSFWRIEKDDKIIFQSK